MKKFSLISFVLVITFMFSSMAIAAKPQPTTPSENVIYGCYQKVNGQLRIVSASSQCRPSELLISWNILGLQGPTGIVATSTFSGSRVHMSLLHKWHNTLPRYNIFDPRVATIPLYCMTLYQFSIRATDSHGLAQVQTHNK